MKVSCVPYIVADGCRREFGAIWSLVVRLTVTGDAEPSVLQHIMKSDSGQTPVRGPSRIVSRDLT